MSNYDSHRGRDSQYRDEASLVTNASNQHWFLKRQDVPIGYAMLVIKNNRVAETFTAGMQWSSSIPIWHKGGAQLILVDLRERFETFAFENELYTSDQFLIELTFNVHYKVSDPEKIALHVKDPLAQLVQRTRSRVLSTTLQTSITDFVTQGTNFFQQSLGPLHQDLGEIGLEYKRVDIINFKLPDSARTKYAEVMGNNREMLMEVDRLKTMKDQGVLNDYIKLELIKGISNTQFPPMQLWALQMMGTGGQQNPMAGILGPESQAGPGLGGPLAAGRVLNATAQAVPRVFELDFYSGEHAGTQFPMTPDQDIVIGKDPLKSNIVINHPQISRTHVSVRYDSTQGRFLIKDLGSMNGAAVNGLEIERGGTRTADIGSRVDLSGNVCGFILKAR